MTVYPPGPISKIGELMAFDNVDPQVTYISPDGAIFHIGGPLAPIPDAQDGVILSDIKGLGGIFTHLDNQGARQDGATWQDAMFDVAEYDMVLEVSSPSTKNFRSVKRAWTEAWSPRRLGTLSWWTPDMGEWWCKVRHGKPTPDSLGYVRTRRQKFTWTARNDDAFWMSQDSVATSGTDTSGFLGLSNIGDQEGWPRYLLYGPGTFTIGDGVGGSSIVFGPLADGQIVLLTTLPRLRSIVDLSPNLPTQQLDIFQQLLQDLLNFVTNNNVPPLLQQFESFFGILPPQAQLYSLLDGRFTTPIAPKVEGQPPTIANISYSISGADGNSKIIAALTPLRQWPE